MIRSNSITFSELLNSGPSSNQNNGNNNTNIRTPTRLNSLTSESELPRTLQDLQEKQGLHQRLQQQFQITLRQRLQHQQSLTGCPIEEEHYQEREQFQSTEDNSEGDINLYSSQYKVPIIKENESNWVKAKAKGNWKRIKEISKKEEKRPPWQGPSLSTLNKPDKDALLRAKLLDVTRRMRQSRNTVATQTDNMSTKLMKEVCTDVPYDLVQMIDVEVSTDEWVTLRQAEGPGIFLFTHSVSLMTDRISAEDETTQTPTVKNITLRINNKYLKSPVKNLNDIISKHEKISQQLENIRETNRLLNIPEPSFVYKSETYLNKFSSNNIPNKNDFLCHSKGSNTYSYWGSSYFDYLSGTKIQETYNKNCLIETNQNTSKMLLSPNRKKPILKNRSSIWNEMQQTAIALLIREASSLQRVFEQIAFALGPGVKYKPNIKKFDIPEFLSDKLEPILNDSRKLIEEKKASVKNLESLIQVESS